jgi:ABC-2 type transport system permease protein
VLVLGAKAAASTVRSSCLLVPTVVGAAWLAHESIPARHPVALVAAAVAVLVSASVFGMLVACLFVLTRAAGRIAEAATYPIFILGGLVVPLSLLPSWVRPLATIVSLHWGAELLHAASAGEAQPGAAWLLLAVTTAAYALVAGVLFGRIVDRGRREGTLELF